MSSDVVADLSSRSEGSKTHFFTSTATMTSKPDHAHWNTPLLFMKTGSDMSTTDHDAGSKPRYDNLPIPPVHYVPRPTLQNRIHEHFLSYVHPGDNRNQAVLLYGLGGAGKSQLALNYIHESGHNYHAIFWLRADSRQTIEHDFFEIYQLLFENSSVSTHDAVLGVRSWLEQQTERVLLVFDDANSTDDPRGIDFTYFLPLSSQLDVVITARKLIGGISIWAATIEVEVGKMMQDEAAQLFCEHADLEMNQAHMDEIDIIIGELGYFALAITLTGARMGSAIPPISSPQTFRDEYRHFWKDSLGEIPTSIVNRYPRNLLNTLETSFEAVQQRSLTASKILRVLAFLSPSDIFLGLFDLKHGSSEPVNDIDQVKSAAWPSILSPQVIDRSVLEAAFHILQAHCLVLGHSRRDAYLMHKLVHQWSRDRLGVEEQQRCALDALDLLGKAVEKYTYYEATKKRLMPHLKTAFVAVSTICGVSYSFSHRHIDLIATFRYFFQLSGHLADEYDIGRFHADITEKSFGIDHPTTILSLDRLAATLKSQARYKEATSILLRVVQSRERMMGPHHPETLTSKSNLAKALHSQGELKEAEIMFRQILQAMENSGGAERPAYLAVQNNLALTLSSQGHDPEAEVILRRMLTLPTAVTVSEYTDLVTSMSTLGLVMARQTRYEDAEMIYRQALALCESILGEDHPTTLSSMNDLAGSLSEQGKFTEAEKIYHETVARSVQLLGYRHTLTLTSMDNQASILSSQGKYVESEKLHRDVLRRQEIALGKSHPSTLVSMNNLASVLSSQGKYADSESIHRHVLQLQQEALGESHPSTLTSMNNLALVLSSQGKHDVSETIHREVLSLSSRLLGMQHPSTLASMNNLASVLNKQSKYKEAETLHREVLALSVDVLGQRHPDTVARMHNLALVLSNLGQYLEAETMLREALRLLEVILGEHHPLTLTSMNNLAWALKGKGDIDGALQLMRTCSKQLFDVLGPAHPYAQDAAATLEEWLDTSKEKDLETQKSPSP